VSAAPTSGAFAALHRGSRGAGPPTRSSRARPQLRGDATAYESRVERGPGGEPAPPAPANRDL